MTALSPAPDLSPEEAARVAAPEAFRETTVDQLDRSHFGLCLSIPDRQVVGYLYAIHDDFNDGYPSRTLVIVSDEGQEVHWEEFTDSDPASYPKTMRTACRVESFDAAEEPEEVTVERIVDALYGVKWPDGEPLLHMARVHTRKLATAALTALRGDRGE